MNLIGTSTLFENRDRTFPKPKMLCQAKHQLQSESCSKETIRIKFNIYLLVEYATYFNDNGLCKKPVR